MDISHIHFHDTKIHRVIEDTDAKTLTMEVTYPVDWDNNIFEKRLLVFEDVECYRMDDSAYFSGPPTILDADIVESSGKSSRLRLQTNAGSREFNFRSVSLEE